MINYKQLIINWYEINKRDLPWRGTNNPYDTFLSEFILQQTRIEQGKPYFLRLKKSFPTIHHLAAATEEEILLQWQGLGYYSRARNMHKSAVAIEEAYHGEIPNQFESLKKLKGIGEYTAAAIASIGFNQPVPLMDGNVFRVVSRIFGIETPIDTAAGKQLIRDSLTSFFDFENAGRFNEAMMDFGAMQCTPAHTICTDCPLRCGCKAFQTDSVDKFPVKLKHTPQKTRFLNYLVLHSRQQPIYLALNQRIKNDIWKNLYEFPLIESDTEIADRQLTNADFWESVVSFSTAPQFEKVVRKSQKLTHQLLNVSFTMVSAQVENMTLSPDYFLICMDAIQQKPFPIMLSKFIKEWMQQSR